MTEEEARALAKFIRSEISGAIAVATQYGRYIGGGYSVNDPWIVVANGTIIRSRKDLL